MVPSHLPPLQQPHKAIKTGKSLMTDSKIFGKQGLFCIEPFFNVNIAAKNSIGQRLQRCYSYRTNGGKNMKKILLALNTLLVASNLYAHSSCPVGMKPFQQHRFFYELSTVTLNDANWQDFVAQEVKPRLPAAISRFDGDMITHWVPLVPIPVDSMGLLGEIDRAFQQKYQSKLVRRTFEKVCLL